MSKVNCETMTEFWRRVEREGRREAAEVAKAELLAGGKSKRAAQAELVNRYQPLDGTLTRAWPTPNSWDKRLYWKKEAPKSDEILERDLEWVYHNPDKSPDDAPTPGAKWWLTVAKAKPSDFMKAYREVLPRIVNRQDSERCSRRRKKLTPEQWKRLRVHGEL